MRGFDLMYEPVASLSPFLLFLIVSYYLEILPSAGILRLIARRPPNLNYPRSGIISPANLLGIATLDPPLSERYFVR